MQSGSHSRHQSRLPSRLAAPNCSPISDSALSSQPQRPTSFCCAHNRLAIRNRSWLRCLPSQHHPSFLSLFPLAAPNRDFARDSLLTIVVLSLAIYNRGTPSTPLTTHRSQSQHPPRLLGSYSRSIRDCSLFFVAAPTVISDAAYCSRSRHYPRLRLRLAAHTRSNVHDSSAVSKPDLALGSLFTIAHPSSITARGSVLTLAASSAPPFASHSYNPKRYPTRRLCTSLSDSAHYSVLTTAAASASPLSAHKSGTTRDAALGSSTTFVASNCDFARCSLLPLTAPYPRSLAAPHCSPSSLVAHCSRYRHHPRLHLRLSAFNRTNILVSARSLPLH